MTSWTNLVFCLTLSSTSTRGMDWPTSVYSVNGLGVAPTIVVPPLITIGVTAVSARPLTSWP